MNIKILKNVGIVIVVLGLVSIFSSSSADLITEAQRAANTISVCMILIGMGIELFVYYKQKKEKKSY